MEFYLGAHHVGWLATAGFPLFVSHRWLRTRVHLPRAIAPWALDSGSFTELRLNGGWTIGPREYVAAVRRYRDEVGMMQWAAPQDWMCEPVMVERTGLSVSIHQHRTLDNFQALRWMAPDLPIVPVLQGWTLDDYERHAEMYATAGIDLRHEPLIGLGSVCRRQATSEIEAIVTRMRAHGFSLHGFGVKIGGLRRYGPLLTSADSMAWSFDARRNHPPLPGHERRHAHCGNCIDFARLWRDRLLSRLEPAIAA